jgi:predicted secreted acid phosphatase
VRVRFVTVLLAILSLSAAVALAREPKPPAEPQDIVEYHDSGEWGRAIAKQAQRARTFVRGWLARHPKPRSRRPAVVLDIDDTALSLYACGKARNFEGVSICAVETDLPAIRPVRSFARYAQRRGVALVFITGRPEGLRQITRTALRSAGYRGWKRLVLRPADDHATSMVPYKSGARRALTRAGYRILANLGDQRSDLKGGWSLRSYKLPNPMYFTP